MRARLQREGPTNRSHPRRRTARRGAGESHQRQDAVITSTRRTLLAVIAACTFATAVIHIAYAFPTAMFIASGVAYLILLAAFFAPALRSFRGPVGVALALLAVANIVGWYATGARIPLAYLDKAFEAVLLGSLGAYVLVARRASAMPVRVAPGRRGR